MQYSPPLDSTCMGQMFAAKFAYQPVVMCHDGPVYTVF